MSSSRFPTFRRIFTWRTARLLALSAATLATLAALFYAVEDWRGKRDWEKYRRSAEARGVNFDLKKLIPPLVPPELNLASSPFFAAINFSGGAENQSLHKAWDEFERKLWTAYRPEKGSWFDGVMPEFPQWAAAFENPPHARRGASMPKTDESALGEKAAAEKLLDALKPFAPMMSEIQAAAARPYARFPIHYEKGYAALVPHLAPLKGLAQAFRARAQMELAVGKTEAAQADVKTIWALSAALRNERTLISQLVRQATFYIGLAAVWEGLARHAWTDRDLQYFEEHCRRFDPVPALESTLAMERVVANQIDDDIRREPKIFFKLSVPSKEPPLRIKMMFLWPSGWFDLEKLHCNERLDSICSILRARSNFVIDPEQVRREQSRLEGALRQRTLWDHEEMEAALLPPLGKLVEKLARVMVMAKEGETACALERFRLARGHYPENLAELQPSVLSEAPRDLITDQPLIYKRVNPQQYLLYSVGWNKTDDGGSTERDPKTGEPLDWVWPEPRR